MDCYIKLLNFSALTPASTQDTDCLSTMKQEEFDSSLPPPPLLLGLEQSCPPLCSLTASIEDKDCHREDKVGHQIENKIGHPVASDLHRDLKQSS